MISLFGEFIIVVRVSDCLISVSFLITLGDDYDSSLKLGNEYKTEVLNVHIIANIL